MKVGDLVKWIGFPGASLSAELTGPKEFGIIISIDEFSAQDTRINVAWGDGSFGCLLYPGTIEVVNGS